MHEQGGQVSRTTFFSRIALRPCKAQSLSQNLPQALHPHSCGLSHVVRLSREYVMHEHGGQDLHAASFCCFVLKPCNAQTSGRILFTGSLLFTQSLPTLGVDRWYVCRSEVQRRKSSLFSKACAHSYLCFPVSFIHGLAISALILICVFSMPVQEMVAEQ